MLKFIESDASGLPRKRRQVSQACEPCRRRKKRCHHVENLVTTGQIPDEATRFTTEGARQSVDLASTGTHPPAPARSLSDSARPSSAATTHASPPTIQSPWRPSHPATAYGSAPLPAPLQSPVTSGPGFHAAPVSSSTSTTPTNTATTTISGGHALPSFASVGNATHRSSFDDRLAWNDTARSRPPLPLPQVNSTFVGDTNPASLFSPRSTRDGSRGGVGVWQSTALDRPDATASSNTGQPAASSATTTSKPRFEGPRSAVRETVNNFVREHCLTCRPPPADYAVLRQIYLSKLDPIFPALSEPLSRPLPPGNSPERPSDIIVQQVVSLAAASDPASSKHLRLGGPNGSTTSELLDPGTFCASLSSAVHAALDAGFLAFDRVLHMRVLLVFSLYMHPTGSEDADLPALLHSHAVHHMVTLGIHLELGNKDPVLQRETCTVFCCLWALDRMSAAFYGRATLMHERDFGWDMGEAIARQAPTFRLLLTIIRLMDEVFALYRPIVKVREPLIVEMPIFEQLIIDADAQKVTDATLASLEVLYHAVAILSCRYPDGSKESAMPAPATNSRRSLSADRITAIVSDEFEGCLSYLPFIPYAVSLSLSVAYRKMRFSSVPMFRTRGKRAFRENTVMLRKLGEAFWTAKALAGMAEKTLKELDKATASYIEGEMGQNGNSTRNGSMSGPVVQNGIPPSSPGGSSAAAAAAAATLGGMASLGVNSAGPSSTAPTMAAATPVDRPGSVLSGAGAGSVYAQPLHDGGRFGHLQQSQQQSQQQHPHPHHLQGGYASEMMMDARDIDVFGHLDPTFDIGAVDAVLDGNLDFGTSSNWFDMQQMWG